MHCYILNCLIYYPICTIILPISPAGIAMTIDLSIVHLYETTKYVNYDFIFTVG